MSDYVCIAPDVKLGENVKLSKFINLYGCEIGDETRIGSFVEIQKNAKVGARCKISSHTFICEGVEIEAEVFVGHGVTFINDHRPKATNANGELQGEALTFSRTVTSLTILMALAVFVMYVILAILYESYVHPLTVLSTLPTALVGGLLTLLVFGQEASLYAFVGMFMLMGIVKKNGIMIVDFARHRVEAGEAADQAIHDASMDRFRPILMTTLAAVFGAVPIALGYGADGSSRRPLGLVVVGGLIVSQFITLYITPVIYLYLEEFQEKVLDRTSFFRSRRSRKPVLVEGEAGD